MTKRPCLITLTLTFNLVFSLFCLDIHGINATEVDSFTQRYEPLNDSLSRVNELTNELLQQALKEANEADTASATASVSTSEGVNGVCNEQLLYQKVRKKLGGSLWGNLEVMITKDRLIDQKVITRANSIYGGLSFFSSFPLFLVKMGTLLKVNGTIVGSDKFGHFFEEGFVYFERAYLQGQGLEAGLRYGEETEGGIFGMQTTGIWSHSDLVANLRGMIFWKKLLGHYFADGLGNDGGDEGTQPLVECRGQEWVLNSPWDWREVIDASWDEGINCNKYYSDKFARTIQKKLQLLEEKNGKNLRFTCPVDPEKCGHLSDLFRHDYQYPESLIKQLLAPECYGNF